MNTDKTKPPYREGAKDAKKDESLNAKYSKAIL
jgi:hypothetical protein